MYTNYPITVKTTEDGRKIQTKPDYWWIYKDKMVYLDGDEVHPEGDLWDEEVVELLKMKGFMVKRIRYHAPLSEWRKREVLDEITVFVGFDVENNTFSFISD